MKEQIRGGSTTQEELSSAKSATCAEQRSLLSIALKYDPTLLTRLMKISSRHELDLDNVGATNPVRSVG